ncbi:MAG: protein translocase subunit SecD, partial [Candidatus Kapabacteria bacterium]|nr:protein translocase subunit SecD [Candidatus Kapabacteria bacterium]
MLGGYYAQSEKSSYQPFDLILKKAEDFPETGLYRFIISGKQLPQLLKILDRPDVKRAMPADIDIIVAAKPEGTPTKDGTPEIFDVYGVAREADLTGDVVTEAFPSFDQASNRPVVLMEMNADGAERWAQITGANINKRIAIVLDGRVYSAPVVQNKIPNGSSQITGSGSPEEANLLAVVLKAGALKAPVKIIEERVVGPSLGEDSIRRGISSSLMSFALIILFMLLYYAWGGGIADIALLMNVLLVVAGLAGFGGTLTLPGIAGLILSTAMAVDANILIFERMREELYAGKTLKAAVDQGFEKAWSAIIDSNITHMLATIPLLIWGSGPVKGFAVTLLAGAIITLFTAVVITRAMFGIIVDSGATTFNIGQKRTA